MMPDIKVFQPSRLLLYHNAIEIQRWAFQCLDNGYQYLLIDLENVSFLDSSGLGMLMSTLDRVRRRGGAMALSSPHGQARMMLEVCELEQIFFTCANRCEFEQAIANHTCL